MSYISQAKEARRLITFNFYQIEAEHSKMLKCLKISLLHSFPRWRDRNYVGFE